MGWVNQRGVIRSILLQTRKHRSREGGRGEEEEESRGPRAEDAGLLYSTIAICFYLRAGH